jgi:hypothetical protein
VTNASRHYLLVRYEHTLLCSLIRIMNLMEISVKVVEEQTVHDVHRCNGAFTIDSKLILRVENDMITFLADSYYCVRRDKMHYN